MKFLDLYIGFIRAVLILLIIYHIYKRDFKILVSPVLAFALTFLLGFLESKFNIKIDSLGGIIYITLIFMTIYLGNVQKYYDKFFWWDMLAHFLSGIGAVSFGIAIFAQITNSNRLSILFFSFIFSVAVQTLWEVMEYIPDVILHTNHQRWQLNSESVNHKSKIFAQPAGLVDTMNDTILGILGTSVACFAWWFRL